MSKSLIQLEKVSKRYWMGSHFVDAIQGIVLSIERGEYVGIMGPSGSGKSTLMHLLGCLDTPSAGEYLLNDVRISSLNDKALSMIRATQIGFVFQAYNLIPQLNVFENIQVPFSYGNSELSSESIIKAIDRVGLSHRRTHLPTELSGGEMQRVAIARALAINPLMILADEPTGNLDTSTGQKILSLFKELNDQGVTIVLVTHDENVGRHCRRLIRMKDGQIIEDRS